MAEINERLEKQMEGTNLALAAVAEVLQKMDDRLAKEEHDAIANAEASAAEAAKADLVKSVASEVVALLKEGGDQGMDVSGDDRKAQSTGKGPQDADDSESAANVATKIEDQQNTIQAAYHGDEDDDKKEKGMYKEDDDDEDGSEKAMKKDDDDDKADDIPESEEKGMDDDKDDDDMEKMQKQLASLQKQLAETQSNMQKAIQSESEDRLRKMGFREENGLQAPQQIGLGVDSTTPIQKSTAVDTPDQLAELSYSELRNMQHKIESGDTDGLPRELLG
tara:strand:+ start:1121 stop:1954 length:834 start_codon:yes stop_codon:yes gene_type:complete